MGRFDDQVAIVTGAGSGTGAAIATRLAKEGASVVCTDLDGAPQTAALLGDRGRAVRLDVADAGSVARLVAEVRETYGRLDALFNCAGVDGMMRPLTELSEENLRAGHAGQSQEPVPDDEACDPAHGRGRRRRRCERLRHVGARRCPRLRALRGGQGRAAAVHQDGGAGVWPERCARERDLPERDRHSDVPATTAGMPKEVLDGLLSRQGIRRLARVEEVAAAAVFLASDDASYLTGVVLPTDGGYLAG
jgi:NAD(P)-dependent dehydrogenase (short-subunit alcohol dehydrogenase family)